MQEQKKGLISQIDRDAARLAESASSHVRELRRALRDGVIMVQGESIDFRPYPSGAEETNILLAPNIYEPSHPGAILEALTILHFAYRHPSRLRDTQHGGSQTDVLRPRDIAFFSGDRLRYLSKEYPELSEDAVVVVLGSQLARSLVSERSGWIKPADSRSEQLHTFQDPMPVLEVVAGFLRQEALKHVREQATQYSQNNWIQGARVFVFEQFRS